MRNNSATEGIINPHLLGNDVPKASRIRQHVFSCVATSGNTRLMFGFIRYIVQSHGTGRHNRHFRWEFNFRFRPISTPAS
jgi:hypothetical protein